MDFLFLILQIQKHKYAYRIDVIIFKTICNIIPIKTIRTHLTKMKFSTNDEDTLKILFQSAKGIQA